MTSGQAVARAPHVLSGPARIVLIVGIQAGLAAVFWFVAARLTSTRALGIAAALYTALQFVNYVTGMGLTVTLARFGADAGRDQDAWFGWSLIVTSAASAIGTVVFLGFVASPATELMRSGAVAFIAFFALTAGISIGLLVDVRLIASGRWGWLTAKNLLIGLVRIPLVLVHPAGSEALWLFTLIAAPQAIFGVIFAIGSRWIMNGRVRFHRPPAWRQAVHYSVVNWAAILATQAPAIVLPLVVALHVRAVVNGPFFLAWSIAVAVFLAPGAIAQVVLVEGSREPHDFRRRARHAMSLSIGISALALLGALAFVPFITTVYGPAYRLSAEILPLLVAASIPWSVAVIRLSEARLRHDHVTTVAITLTFGVGIVGMAVTLVPVWGVAGAVLAWVAGTTLAAAVGLALSWIRWHGPVSVLDGATGQSLQSG